MFCDQLRTFQVHIRVPARDSVDQELAVDESGPAHLGVGKAGNNSVALKEHRFASRCGCPILFARFVEIGQNDEVTQIPCSERRVPDKVQCSRQVQNSSHAQQPQPVGREDRRNPRLADSDELQMMLEAIEHIRPAKEKTRDEGKRSK